MGCFRKIILSVVFAVFACAVMAQGRRALVIGIGQYPVGSGWSTIHGDNDIEIVRSFLVSNDFAGAEITTLKNAQATKANIVRQLRAIASTAKQGDQIYIHFSGHGQQITDLNGDEPEGFDEAWIPYDARKNYVKGVYEGGQHLIDDELNVLLRAIRAKIGAAGRLVVVADACHSGDSSRGDEDEEEGLVVRGTPIRFEIPQQVAPSKQSAQPIEWVMISACKSYQNNYEYRDYGVLSWSLYSKRGEIAGRPLSAVREIIAESVSNLSPRVQSVQVDFPQNLSNSVIFGGR